MKKMIVALVVVMSLIGGKVFATGEENINRGAIETFKKEFPNAEFASWDKIVKGDLYRVRFVYDNQGFVAFLNEEGALVASARLVTMESLPYTVKEVFRKKYNDAEISKIEELTMDGTSYMFTFESEGTRIVLRIFQDGYIRKISQEKVKNSDKKFAKR